MSLAVNIITQLWAQSSSRVGASQWSLTPDPDHGGIHFPGVVEAGYQ